MPKAMKIGYDALIQAARREIEEVDPDELMARLERGDVIIVDVRDIREIERDGRIPGSFHCPRGMLEFWIDPASPYFKPISARPNASSFIARLTGARRSRRRPRRKWAWPMSRISRAASRLGKRRADLWKWWPKRA